MKSIRNISFSGKKAFIRVDFNVPFNESDKITDNSRIVAALPTIQHVLLHGGSLVKHKVYKQLILPRLEKDYY